METNWSTVERDAQIFVTLSDGTILRRHFARYSEEEHFVYVYADGRTSFSSEGQETQTYGFLPSRCTVKGEVDWTAVPVDTLLTVFIGDDIQQRYFAKYENEHVYVWCGGATSKTADGMIAVQPVNVELSEEHANTKTFNLWDSPIENWPPVGSIFRIGAYVGLCISATYDYENEKAYFVMDLDSEEE